MHPSYGTPVDGFVIGGVQCAHFFCIHLLGCDVKHTALSKGSAWVQRPLIKNRTIKAASSDQRALEHSCSLGGTAGDIQAQRNRS